MKSSSQGAQSLDDFIRLSNILYLACQVRKVTVRWHIPQDSESKCAVVDRINCPWSRGGWSFFLFSVLTTACDTLSSSYKMSSLAQYRHPDIKPQHIIAFVPETDGLTMNLGDMGIARPYRAYRARHGKCKQSFFGLPIASLKSLHCNCVGTSGWIAPDSFMAHDDDRFVNCYSITRLLFFLLVASAPRYPAEIGAIPTLQTYGVCMAWGESRMGSGVQLPRCLLQPVP